MSIKIQTAVDYYKLGWSIIPVGRDKKPLVDWKKYQTERPAIEEMVEWFKKYPSNMAVITGEISGIVVVDVEAGGDTNNLPPTVISRTGGGGWHYFYRYPGHKVENAVRILDKIDIRGDGGYVVLPPSLHESGKNYEWVVSPDMADFAEFPEGLFRKVSPIFAEGEKDWDKIIKEENPEGTRNSKGAVIAGKLVHDIPEELWEVAGWPAFKEWNQEQNKPPLEEKELRSIWDSISKKHATDRVDHSSENQKEFKPIHISEILKRDYPEPEWLVKNLIPTGCITAISGPPASCKTWVMLELAIEVSDGGAIFNQFETTKRGVLIVDEENGIRLFHDRFKLLGADDDSNVHILSLENFKLEEESVAKLISLCKEKGLGVIIFDSLVRIHNGNENDARDMSRVANLLKRIAKEGITVIFTHHNRKSGPFRSNPSQDMRGSSDILASVDCHIGVSRKEDIITIDQTKLRPAEEMKPFRIKMSKGEGGVELEYVGEIDKEKSKVEILKEAINGVLENEERPLNQRQLADLIREGGLTVNPGTLRTALGELDGQVYSRQGYRNAHYYSLNPISDETMEELRSEARNASESEEAVDSEA